MDEQASNNSIAEDLKLSGQARLFVWLGLFYAIFLVYQPSLNGPFLYDGVESIVYNKDLRSANPLACALNEHPNSLYFDRRPVGGVLTWLNFKMFGLNPYGYRVTNLLLHWFMAILIGEAILLFGRRLNLKKGVTLVAVSTALLWALHPVNTMPVAYIYQRMEILMALFYLGALACLLKTGDGEKNAMKWRIGAAFCAVLSVLSKESGISVVGSLFLVEWLVLNKKPQQLLKAQWGFYGAISMCLGLIIFWHFSGPRMVDLTAGGELASPWRYFQTQCRVIADYLMMMFWPKDLVFAHTPRHATQWTQWLPYLLVLCCLAGGVILVSKKKLWVILSVLLFIFTLAPTSSFVPIAVEPKVDYRMYLSSIPVFVVCLGGVFWLCLRLGKQNWSTAFVGVFAVLLVLDFASARSRARVYSNAIVLWEDTALKQPLNTKAWHNLGIVALQGKQLEKVKFSAEQLSQIEDTFNNSRSGSYSQHLLGVVAEEEKAYEKAAQHFQSAATLNSEMEVLKESAALNLAKAGKLIEAEKLLEELAKTDPLSLNYILTQIELARQAKKETSFSEWKETLKKFYPNYKFMTGS